MIMVREDYFFKSNSSDRQDMVFVLIIYDIVDNKKRVKFAKHLEGYGNRVQKSAFEAKITKKKYKKLLNEIPSFVSEEDSVRTYRINGKGHISSWGAKVDFEQEDIIFI